MTHGVYSDTTSPPVDLALPTLTPAFIAQPNVYIMDETTTAFNTSWKHTQMPYGTISYTGGKPTKTYSGTAVNCGFGLDFSPPASGYIKISGSVNVTSGALNGGAFFYWRAYVGNDAQPVVTTGINTSGSFSDIVVEVPAGTTAIYFFGYSTGITFTLSSYSAVECDAGGTTVDPTDLMPSETTLLWPDEAYDPLNQSPPIEYVLIKPGDYTARKSNPAFEYLGTLSPLSGGTALNPVHYIALDDVDLNDVGLNYDLNNLPGPWDRNPGQQVLIENIFCLGDVVYAFGNCNSNYMRFVGFDMGNVDKGSFFYGQAHHCIFKKLRITGAGTDAVVQPIKFFQADIDDIKSSPQDNIVSECLIERYPPFTNQDCIGIQIERGCFNNKIEYCTILNYTDAIQTLFRSTSDYGLCAGNVINNCYTGYTDHVREYDGKRNVLGCEQAGFDFKIGGAIGNPIVCSRNVVFGGRPNYEPGARSIGDAVSMHFCSDYCSFIENVFADNECVITLNLMSDGRAPNTVMNDNLITGTKSHGANLFQSPSMAWREGQVRQLTNTMTFTGNDIVDCDEWADRDTDPALELIQASVTTDNIVYGTIAFGFQFADQAAWESAGNEAV